MFFRHIYTRNIFLPKMSLEKIIINNKDANGLLNALKSELSALRTELLTGQKNILTQENLVLMKQVEAAKSQLILLETKNGKKQISLPTNTNTQAAMGYCSGTNIHDVETETKTEVEQKKTKDKKQKKEKANTSDDKTAALNEPPIDVGRLDFRVGKIIEVSRHPDADTLYIEKIDCGEPNPRTVISGLVNNVPIEEMRDIMVVLLCNLKPAKMRGITSEAMVMCAVSPEKLEILRPPVDSVPGDFVYCEGYERKPDAQLSAKKKVFESCAPDLKTNNDTVACYKNAPLHVPGKGKITAKTLKNVNIK